MVVFPALSHETVTTFSVQLSLFAAFAAAAVNMVPFAFKKVVHKGFFSSRQLCG